MKNSIFLQKVFMVLVIFSLFTPSVVPLLQWDNDFAVVVEILEEEPKKETKKELEQKDVFFESLAVTSNFHIAEQMAIASYYRLNTSDFSKEIPLPPPEYLG